MGFLVQWNDSGEARKALSAINYTTVQNEDKTSSQRKTWVEEAYEITLYLQYPLSSANEYIIGNGLLTDEHEMYFTLYLFHLP